MKSTLRLAASSLVLALTCPLAVQAEEYYLYAPSPSEGKIPSGPDEGVLVKSITIKRGDTLYRLSRKYSGKGFYYPQILLFNEIRNPDLIYAGNSLLVPVSAKGKEKVELPKKGAPSKAHGKKVKKVKGAAEAKVPKVAEEARRPAESLPAPPKARVEAVAPRAAKPPVESKAPVVRRTEEAEQVLFEKGISAYKAGSYQQSLDAFDQFLAKYPNSPLVPDVSLYRADALMKLAGN